MIVTIRDIKKLLMPIKRLLSQVVSRGVLVLVNDALKMQECQITMMADETLDGVERFQNYGFTSNPHSGAECINLSVGANRSHSVCIAIDDRRYRLKQLLTGEVALYDDIGNIIKLGRDAVTINSVSDLNITAVGDLNISSLASLNITAPLTTINGDVVVTGDVTASGISLVHHKHPGDSFGTTGEPN